MLRFQRHHDLVEARALRAAVSSGSTAPHAACCSGVYAAQGNDAAFVHCRHVKSIGEIDERF
jgi:hypothetical protein